MNAATPDLFDRLADEIAGRYDMLIELLAAAYLAGTGALGGGALHARSVGGAAVDRAMRMVATLIIPATRVALAQAANEGTLAAGAPPPSQDTLDALRDTGIHIISAMAVADATTARLKLRDLALRYQLALRTMAPLIARLAAAGELRTDSFAQLDRAGRHYRSAEFVRRVVRDQLLTAYCDNFIAALVATGTDRFEMVLHEDAGSAEVVLQVSILGGDPQVAAWSELEPRMHANSRNTLRRVGA